MQKISFLLSIWMVSLCAFGQSPLTVDHIMQDPDWYGPAPDRLSWSFDGDSLFFHWNPKAQFEKDSVFAWTPKDERPAKLALAERKKIVPPSGIYDREQTHKVYTHEGNLILVDQKKGIKQQLTFTTAKERPMTFSPDGEQLFFFRENNVYVMNLLNRQEEQLTDIRAGKKPQEKEPALTQQESWLKNQEMALIAHVRTQEEERLEKKAKRAVQALPAIAPIYLNNQTMQNVRISPGGRYVSMRLWKSGGAKRTKVPDYIDISGYTKELTARSKVGSPQSSYQMLLSDLLRDTSYTVEVDSLPGIYQKPLFLKEYHKDTLPWNPKYESPKPVIIHGPFWSPNGENAVVVVRSQDFKDRWIARLDPQSGKLVCLDHQHDEAWIGGPGIVRWTGTAGAIGWFPDSERIWFVSEESGYAHLYLVETSTGEKRPLTIGKFEVYQPTLSQDGKHLYFIANEQHPGQRDLYRLDLETNEWHQLTNLKGGISSMRLSRDEKHLAFTHSIPNRPWEIFVQENKKKAEPRRITFSQTDTFLSYPWRTPELVRVPAADGDSIPARLYLPDSAKANGAAVIFVHGAGYLQNAHGWWSSYFREYFFHNLLVDKGYTVLDMDFRASAGNGRNWRTGVYRDMGGLDLSDNLDGRQYLIEQHGIDSSKVGIYGGSYGGFITLMALFKAPGKFAAGAALRPVTDWAHYNHGYTASMLNQPQDDTLSYKRSSPMYFAAGLQDPLLICHGMLDTNVQFQDVVRLAQRLIELRKEDWEVALFPVEGHGFKEPTSWTDEYKRILKLFETHLR
ncbi:MAG: prolyl oligopeptidase family serine peptidase [Bacteroidota bacterium]